MYYAKYGTVTHWTYGTYSKQGANGKQGRREPCNVCVKVSVTLYPIEYKTVMKTGDRESTGTKDAKRPREPGGPNRLGAINFWKKLEPWGNFSGQKCPNTTTVSGASGQHMRYCKRLTQIFRQGCGGRGTLLGRQGRGLSREIDARRGFQEAY